MIQKEVLKKNKRREKFFSDQSDQLKPTQRDDSTNHDMTEYFTYLPLCARILLKNCHTRV